MLAVDTNVVVRIIIADDAVQSRKAHQLLTTSSVFVTRTVLLESEWVLRKVYGLSAAAVLQHLSAFVGLPQVSVEQPIMVANALDWFARGMDFADALHLAAAGDCEAFATFDRKLAATAQRARAGKVKAL